MKTYKFALIKMMECVRYETEEELKEIMKQKNAHLERRISEPLSKIFEICN